MDNTTSDCFSLFIAGGSCHLSSLQRSITRVSAHSSTEAHTLYPDKSIPEYVWAAMTTAAANIVVKKLSF